MTESRRPGDEGPPGSQNETIRAEFDWTERRPSAAIVETVAIAANREPMELKPIYGTLDPNALDALIRPTETNSPDGSATVSFAHDGYEVTVQCDGTVVVRPVEVSTDQE